MRAQISTVTTKNKFTTQKLKQEINLYVYQWMNG